MASQDIQKHFKKLRIASPATHRQRVDPLSEEFSDESDNGREDASKPAATNKPSAPAPVAKASRGSIASPFASVAYLDDSEDEPLEVSKKRADKQTSPAPMAEDATKPSSLDKAPVKARASRSSVASPFASIGYLDDSADELSDTSPKRTDRRPSPAPPQRPRTEVADSAARGVKAEKEQVHARRTRSQIASPFAGTQYLEDSDSDSGEEAISDSRKASTHSTTEQPLQELDPDDPGPLSEQSLRVKRVDKLKPAGSGVSWKAFRAQSDSKTALKAAEIEALRASLNQRGKSISFSTHAITDEGKRLPIEVAKSVEEPGTTRGRTRPGPRRVEDAWAASDMGSVEATSSGGVPSGDRAQQRRAGSLPKIKVTNSTNI
ncbi:hypothetical protein BJ546DRAFT_534762 [Cryomyces antarcticus]